MLEDYETENDPLPRSGERQALVDSHEQAVTILKSTGVRIVRLAEAAWEHVLTEGEGHLVMASSREGQEAFWEAASSDPGTDDY